MKCRLNNHQGFFPSSDLKVLYLYKDRFGTSSINLNRAAFLWLCCANNTEREAFDSEVLLKWIFFLLSFLRRDVTSK